MKPEGNTMQLEVTSNKNGEVEDILAKACLEVGLEDFQEIDDSGDILNGHLKRVYHPDHTVVGRDHEYPQNPEYFHRKRFCQRTLPNSYYPHTQKLPPMNYPAYRNCNPAYRSDYPYPQQFVQRPFTDHRNEPGYFSWRSHNYPQNGYAYPPNVYPHQNWENYNLHRFTHDPEKRSNLAKKGSMQQNPSVYPSCRYASSKFEETDHKIPNQPPYMHQNPTSENYSHPVQYYPPTKAEFSPARSPISPTSPLGNSQMYSHNPPYVSRSAGNLNTPFGRNIRCSNTGWNTTNGIQCKKNMVNNSNFPFEDQTQNFPILKDSMSSRVPQMTDEWNGYKSQFPQESFVNTGSTLPFQNGNTYPPHETHLTEIHERIYSKIRPSTLNESDVSPLHKKQNLPANEKEPPNHHYLANPAAVELAKRMEKKEPPTCNFTSNNTKESLAQTYVNDSRTGDGPQNSFVNNPQNPFGSQSRRSSIRQHQSNFQTYKLSVEDNNKETSVIKYTSPYIEDKMCPNGLEKMMQKRSVSSEIYTMPEIPDANKISRPRFGSSDHGPCSRSQVRSISEPSLYPSTELQTRVSRPKSLPSSLNADSSQFQEGSCDLDLKTFLKKLQPVLDHLLSIPEASSFQGLHNNPDELLINLLKLWGGEERISLDPNLMVRIKDNFSILIRYLFKPALLAEWGWQNASIEKILDDLVQPVEGADRYFMSLKFKELIDSRLENLATEQEVSVEASGSIIPPKKRNSPRMGFDDTNSEENQPEKDIQANSQNEETDFSCTKLENTSL